MNEAYNMDCMDYMKTLPDNAFDLAVVDPPYGIGDKFKGGKTGKMNFNEIVDKRWDKAPADDYFKELFRISKKSIIWGGNYFPLPPSRAFICWDKGVSEDFSLAMCELAWCSFDGLAKIVRIPVPHDGNKIHPTQKPVALYRWIYKNYAKPGMKILDTHLGSGSSRIAAWDAGLDFVGTEIDEQYFKMEEERFKKHIQQPSLEIMIMQQAEQDSLF